MSYPFQSKYIKIIKLIKKKNKDLYSFLHIQYERLLYKKMITKTILITYQRKNPKTIPVIIISYNQLYYLQKLIDFLLKRKFENIVIIDNASTYPPLINYYRSIEGTVSIEYLKKNLGHKVFFESKELIEKYGKGYYFLTDPDILPNENLPENFAEIMLKTLDKFFNQVTKVGFALRIDDIPEYYKFRDDVLRWEAGFWLNEIEPNVYMNYLDTTFALYKPSYGINFKTLSYYKGIRLGGNFIAKHGGWYVNHNSLTDEQDFYYKNTNKSSSWSVDEHGNPNGEYYKS